jgi:hypothetical protein
MKKTSRHTAVTGDTDMQNRLQKLSSKRDRQKQAKEVSQSATVQTFLSKTQAVRDTYPACRLFPTFLPHPRSSSHPSILSNVRPHHTHTTG